MEVYIKRCKICGQVFDRKALSCSNCGEQNGLEEIPDYYYTLNCSRDSKPGQIQKSFRQLAKKWHPDKNKDTLARSRFIEIATAYQILGDMHKRAVYNQLLEYSNAGKEAEETSGMMGNWSFQAADISMSWSRESYSKFSDTLEKLDSLLRLTKDRAVDLLKGDKWLRKETIHSAKIAGLGYALVGFWFFCIGAVLFYYVFYYIQRRSPAREESLLGILKLLQLLLILLYFILIAIIPLPIHVIFWLNQAALFYLSYLYWGKKI